MKGANRTTTIAASARIAKMVSAAPSISVGSCIRKLCRSGTQTFPLKAGTFGVQTFPAGAHGGRNGATRFSAGSYFMGALTGRDVGAQKVLQERRGSAGSAIAPRYDDGRDGCFRPCGLAGVDASGKQLPDVRQVPGTQRTEAERVSHSAATRVSAMTECANFSASISEAVRPANWPRQIPVIRKISSATGRGAARVPFSNFVM